MADEHINKLADSQSDVDPQALMKADQISKRFGGLPLATLPGGETTLEPDRHYVFSANKTCDLPTITEDLDGSIITIHQLVGTTTISYVLGGDTFNFTLDATGYGDSNGAWIQFRAVYSEVEAEKLWYNITRNFSIDSIDTSFSNYAPIGSLLFFPNDTNLPTDYMECDGSSLSREVYDELFVKIGVQFGNVDGDHFNIPDYRGMFFRGWDHGAGEDPNAATRTDRGDGTTGDFPGTRQEDELTSHTHDIIEGSAGPTGGGALTSGDDYTDIEHQTQTSTPTGGDETRPKNVNVVPCIKVSNLGAAISPEVEAHLVRGQTQTGLGYFDATTYACGTNDRPAVNQHVNYRDTIDAANDFDIVDPGTADIPWVNFFPYRPTANTSKTILKYRATCNDRSLSNEHADFEIVIDWTNSTYSLLIEMQADDWGDCHVKSIFKRDLAFGTLHTIDVGTFDGDVNDSGNSWWEDTDPSIQIGTNGIVRLPVWTRASQDDTSAIHMTIVNYKSAINETQLADAVTDRLRWKQILSTSDDVAPSGEPDGVGTTWSAISESLSQTGPGYYKYNLAALSLAAYINPNDITEVLVHETIGAASGNYRRTQYKLFNSWRWLYGVSVDDYGTVDVQVAIPVTTEGELALWLIDSNSTIELLAVR